MEVKYQSDQELMTIFERIWTEITPEQLANLKNSKFNRELSVDVCPECYIEATDNIGVNGINKFTHGQKMTIHKKINKITEKRV